MSEEKSILCVECRSTFSAEELDRSGATSCPTCGSTGIPADLKDALELHITRHELRILTIWAANYAYQCDKKDENSHLMTVVNGIIKGIRSQHAEVGPLSLHEELQEVADAGHKVQSSIGDFEPPTHH